ncbi:hypothetical protein ACP70R_006591 [Stipagrostis hirtigluma subsp. patula]
MSSTSRRPDSVLLDTHAVAGIQRSSTTACGSTRNGKTIEVSFFAENPPCPSKLFVHSPDMSPTVPPTIVCTEDDLLLLRVDMGRERLPISPRHCDYFIYRASAPSLEMLQRPHPFFHDCDVGVLPRPDGHYSVAALVATSSPGLYNLHLFHSDVSSWSSRSVSVGAPQREFPVEIPPDSCRLHHHFTSNVIAIGGERGTMGWVDLWRGILFCDVLDESSSLRGVPLPLPWKELSYNNGNGVRFGSPVQHRGIAFIRDKGCLKFVHLEISDVRLPGNDPETGAPSFRSDNWVLTTWSNAKMTDSFEDWDKDYTVQASDIPIDSTRISQALDNGPLHRSQDNGLVAEQLALHNLSMSQPAPCVNGKDVVYLVARKKFMHLKAWILAVDMVKGELQDVVEFGTRRQFGPSVIYRPSRISRFMNLVKKYTNPPTYYPR